jgi:adenylate cyclase, class 2
MPMPQETEIKLRIADSKKFLHMLKRAGARRVFKGNGRVHEWNVIFDTPDKALAHRGQLLRIRIETPTQRIASKSSKTNQRVLLTFKRPSSPHSAARSRAPGVRRHKIREELELEVSNAKVIAKICEALGMRPTFTYEKFRTTFAFPASQLWAKGLLIELDETPIGTFAEFEGPSRAIDRAAKMLGYSESDYVLTNYLRLYFEDCRRRNQEPTDMLFRTPKRRQPSSKS